MLLNNEEQALSQFRQLIQESNVNYPAVKNELLLCFLRARKCDVPRAFKALRNYLNMAGNYPELLTDLRLSGLQIHLDQHMQVVGKSRDQHGRRIFIFRAGQWNPNKCTLDDIFRCNVYCLQRLASETDTQIKGIVAIVDLKNLGLHQIRHFTPQYAKKVADLIKDSFPLRFQAIHMVNEPWVFSMLLSIIWPFLTEKIQKRIYHHGSCWTSLQVHIDRAVLPEDYGGLQDPLDCSHWADVAAVGADNLFDFNSPPE